ncbi:DgyrCDS10864 [Dimorphilus gyrociliatus]|uniref:DgyrCDS10864 n=1 Tax=Dimorphilus gyrociliatus TaxID=2664684 RepID=A0A7I8W3I7_9ANNE|nr:DgyrCDS10864 [Dimorphilus gyrociliatus]
MAQAKLTDFFGSRKRKADKALSNKDKVLRTDTAPVPAKRFLKERKTAKASTPKVVDKSSKTLINEALSDFKSRRTKISPETKSIPSTNAKALATKTLRFTTSKSNTSSDEEISEADKRDMEEKKKIRDEILEFRTRKPKNEISDGNKEIKNIKNEILKFRLESKSIKKEIEETTKATKDIRSEISNLRKGRRILRISSDEEDKTEIKVSQKIPKKSLPLPPSYQKLLDTFIHVDTVCKLAHRRKQRMTFEHLKTEVERFQKKNFSKKQLSQIKYIYPKAFNYVQERKEGNDIKYELVIEPCLDSGEYSLATFISRKATFETTLIEKVKEEHEKFLNCLTSPIKVRKEELTRWHPSFDMTKVPDIPESALPESPDIRKFTSVEDALKRLQPEEDTSKVHEPSTPVKQKESEPPKVSSKLKGVSSSLLERIRAKEAKNMAKKLTRTPEEEKRLRMLERLSDISRIVRQVFVGHTRFAIPLEKLIEKVRDSIRTMGITEAKEHILFLESEVPNFLKIMKIDEKLWAKLNMQANMNLIKKQIQDKIDKERS